ncbi:hypothetical protein A2954_02120, partial [Candidatus Roizmanbacteria bacterium RIFCSPLOWO2_01_FULL_37_12]
MRFKIIAFIFLLFSTGNLATAILAKYIIPYLGFFPYKEIAQQFNLPSFLTSFANFDGAHYLLIAKNGYTTYQQAFFPLYPLLIRWLSPLFSNNLLLTGLIISNLSFLVGLYIFSKYLKLTTNNQQLTVWVIIFLLVFPTSFFFAAVYTEGLSFLLFISTLYFLKKEKYGASSIFAILASLTKFLGVFLIIPILLTQMAKLKSQNRNLKLKASAKLLITLFSPILGLTIYSLYLWKTMGDPFFFLNSQWAFGAHRSSNIILLPQVYYRYLNIFFTANLNFQYFISLFEFFTFNFVFIILILDLIENYKLRIKNYYFLGLNLFSLVNLLLPTLTGTFSSIPRYALFSLSFFIYLAQIKKLSL